MYYKSNTIKRDINEVHSKIILERYEGYTVTIDFFFFCFVT